MSALLGGDDRAHSRTASRRGLLLDQDIEDAAGEDEASLDLADRPGVGALSC